MALSHNNPSVSEETDLGTMWQEALIQYYEECGTDLRALPASSFNFDRIRTEQEQQLLLFSEYRHNKGKVDKLRSLISKNSEIIIGVATHIANAASAAFPPSAAILTAFNYVMNASNAVSQDYDMIISFFDIMHSFLERISMLESRMPGEWQFRRFLINVFSAMMTLSAIARKCRLKGRLNKWAKALIDGSDPKLKGAFDSLHMHLQRFESAVMLTTLKHTLDSGRKLDGLGQDVKQVHISIEKNLALSQQNYVLGLESRGHAKEAAHTSHEILTVLARQEGEYTAGLHQVINTLNQISTPKAAQEKVVDAGNRKSMAMRTLETILQYDLDNRADLTDIEAHHLDGTCSWVPAQAEFSDFKAGKVPLLWVSGPAGIGKSTLAYTAVKALQRELIGDTSVVHFFFREDGERKHASQMLRSCALQVASRDNGYREEAVADVQAYEKRPRDKTISPELPSDEAKMWELLFQNKFSKKSKRRLVLVLDGVDEVEEKDRKYIDMILGNISGSGDMNIQVLFTSDPDSFAPDIDTTKLHTLKITKELVLPDMRTVIVERLKNLSRLRKLPPPAKRKIIARLSKQADTMRYLEHMLLRLNQLGRETLVLRQLNDLPLSTAELYKNILEDCQKARTDREIVILRKFFAWIAYAPQPLPLGSANALLGSIADDNTINIDEEIEHRCSRILRVSSSTPDRDDEESQAGSDSGSDTKADPDDFDGLDIKMNKDDDYEVDDINDCFVNIVFQEKGLRNYFRPIHNQEIDKLRSPASLAHVIILETIRSILCTEKEGPVHYGDTILRTHATTGWRWSLQRINPAELSETETARVIESIGDILSNVGGSILKMESQYRPWEPTDIPCVLGATEEEIQGTLDCLHEWAIRATDLPPSLISEATVTWVRPLARNPRELLIKLAEAHATNWLKSYGHRDDMHNYYSFSFAHYALYQGRDLPAVQENEKRRNYFASSNGSINNDSFTIVSGAFPHIDMTAQSYLSVAISMSSHGWEVTPELRLQQLDLALQHSDTDIERMEIYMRMTGLQAELARLEKFTIRESDSEALDAASNEMGESAPDKSDQWAAEALQSITKAAEIASNLSDNSMKDEKVQKICCSVWIFKAKVELLNGDSTNIIAHCRRALQTCSKKEIPAHYEILRPLADDENWPVFLEVIKVLRTDEKVGPWVFLDWYMDDLHKAAKATGEVEFVLELYRGALPSGSDMHESDDALFVGFARFYRDVVGTDGAIAKAKALLNRAIDSRVTTRYVAEASFCLSDILLEEFRHSTQPRDKTAVYNDMRDLVKRVGESMGAEFDPSQSQTAIPLAHMARRMDPVEFQKGLEKTFAGCVAALTDETGWNDMLSLRVLARVLALIGLEREAEIAATCQIYILNMDIFRQENGLGEASSEDGDAEGNQKSREDDEDFGGKDAEENDRNPGNESSDEKDGEAVSTDSNRTVSMPTQPEGGGHHEDVEAEDTDKESVSDVENLRSLDDQAIRCTGCSVYTAAWGGIPVYLCYYCTEVNLCQDCFDKRAKRIAGGSSDEAQVLCPEGHKYIQMPVEGWDGMKNGVFTIDGKKVPFQDWLLELKEKKWPEAWDKFWREQ
ncbi:uncharacterized protein DNG_03938 [Cephalotrichum gorgonifer]|uniref:NACHT domain-containing protein n=1 Tax=Cephalotrichum gorgonifer TaxID=2041049 RepID=A0AAE8MV69_9PEZI|nr:uncharacterized protein DNG_03938 [Cephalotrichum gorgonifer]